MSRYIPVPYDALLGGLLLGTATTPLPEEWNDAYRRAGVTHILVVSGSQVALLVGTLVMVVSALGLSPGIQFALCSIANLLFVLITGADPSIVRAGLMAQISLFAVWSGRSSNVVLTLALTWIVMLLYQPLYLFQAGFQLSFVATAALLWVTPVFRNEIQKHFPNLPEWLTDALALAIGPTVTTLPLGMVLFNAASTVSIISNFTIAPLIEVLVLAGAAGLGLLWLPGPLGGFFLKGLYALMALMHHWLVWLAALPLAYIYVVSPAWWLLVVYYGGLIYYCSSEQAPSPHV